MKNEAVPVEKVCTKCGASYPGTAEFFLLKKLGLRAECRGCSKKYQREYRARNPQKWINYNAKYHIEHSFVRRRVNYILTVYPLEHGSPDVLNTFF